MKHASPIMNKLFLVLTGTGVLLVFILFTDPNKIALPLLIVPFILIGFILYQVSFGLLSLKKSGASSRYSHKIIPLSIAFLGVCLLLLESLHQLTWKDSLLACGFTILLWLYVSRADFLQK
jgi:peptidoglycan/LPS O-acetylase OafA/YrhL